MTVNRHLILGLLAIAPFFPATSLAGQNDIILNEYNAVAGSEYLDDDNSFKSDETFGRVSGNGQNWLEFLIVEDHLDLRGFALEWQYGTVSASTDHGSGTVTFSQEPIWSDLRQGTILTITEWQESWYNDENTVNNNFSREGGVDGPGDQRGSVYNPANDELFLDLGTDTSYGPEVGDYHINVQAGERDSVTGDHRFFSFAGTVFDAGSNSTLTIGIDDDAGLFSVNNNDWAITIKDSLSIVVQGPIGEAFSGSLGVNANEVGKFEGSFANLEIGNSGTIANYKATVIGDYDDGSSGSFGNRNLSTGFEQGVANLQAWFDPADLIGRSNTTSGLAFADNASWSGGVAPSPTQQAVFDQGSATSYVVNVNANDEVHRLLVRNDDVELDLNGNTLTVSAAQEYHASVVGQSDGDTGRLVLSGGGTLSADTLNVAEQTGSVGSLTIAGSGTELTLNRGLYVGGRASVAGGAATVTLDSGSRLRITSADSNTREILKVFAGGTVDTNGGTITIGSGTAPTSPDTVRISSDGNLDIRGGGVTAVSVELQGGAISGYGSLSSAVSVGAPSSVYVPGFDDGVVGRLRLTGLVSSTAGGDLNKTGGGVLEMTGTNSFGGNLTLSDGIVQAGLGVGLPAANTLRIRGGRLESAGSFNRPLGTGVGEVNWSDGLDGGGGGFSALGSELTVNFGGSGTQIEWAVGGFVPDGAGLHLGSDDSDAKIIIVNPINLGATGSHQREVRVTNNGSSSDDLAELSGALSDSGGTQGIDKLGGGRLRLTGSNSYNGPTTVERGQLQADDGVGLPSASLLRLRGGVLETNGTFYRSVGQAGGQVNWTDGIDSGDGGFAAVGGPLAVNLGGVGAAVTWGAGNFVADTGDLVLSSDVADNVVTWSNPINLGANERTVRVEENPNSTMDLARISAVLSGTAQLRKTGGGELELSAVNTYTGKTDVRNGRLTISGSLAGPVSVDTDAAISGNGSVAISLINNGTHSIRAAETLAIAGSVVLGPLSHLAVTDTYSQTRTTESSFQLLTAATGVIGQFTNPPNAGTDSHLGNGYFLQSVAYATDVTINIFAALEGDADGDRDVDITDFNILATNFDDTGANSATNAWTTADFDADGDVDITDFNFLAANFADTGYHGLSGRQVPEPATALLVAFGAALLAASPACFKGSGGG